MISIFHKEATDVEFHSSSHKATFSFIMNTLTNLKQRCKQVNVTITNRDFLKVVLKKNRVNLKKTLVHGKYYRRNRLVTSSTYKTCLVTHSTHLTTRSTCLTICGARLSTRITCLSTHLSICLSMRSTRLSTRSICVHS